MCEARKAVAVLVCHEPNHSDETRAMSNREDRHALPRQFDGLIRPECCKRNPLPARFSLLPPFSMPSLREHVLTAIPELKYELAPRVILLK